MTKRLMVGGVPVGGGAPVSIQSMCNTKTDDVAATVAQIRALEAAGCEIIRVAIPDQAAAEAVDKIKEQISIPTQTPEITVPKLLEFFEGKGIEALGIGCFGPIDVNRDSETYGYITTTPKLESQNYNIV